MRVIKHTKRRIDDSELYKVTIDIDVDIKQLQIIPQLESCDCLVC